MKEIILSNLATESDLNNARTDINNKITGVQGDLKNVNDALNNKINGVQSESNNNNTSLTTKINGVQSESNNKISGVQTEFNNKIKGVQTETDTKITNLNTTLTNKITGVQTESNNKISNLNTTLTTKINDVENSITTVVSSAGFINDVNAAAGSDINTVGTPSVTASKSGNTVTFTFHKLKGATGPQGVAGRDGTNGTNGISIQGPQGVAGKDGKDGTNGTDGVQGSQGSQGTKGDSVAQTMPSNVAYLDVEQTWTKYQNFSAGAGQDSDIRFKTNITPIKNILDDVIKLDIFNYIWNKSGDPQVNTFGVSAQQLEEFGGEFAKLVHVQDDEYNTRSVEYNKLGVLALKVIQEQQVIINDLKSRIEKLENK